jgi:hypothetical protein
MQKLQILLFFVLFSLLACGKIDPEPTIPAYLELEPFEVQALGGAAVHKLPHAFVYVNNIFLGGFPVPGKIPVLMDGDENEIEIFPGIREDGSRQNPSLYPLMAPYKTKITLTRDSVTKIKPLAAYFPNVVVANGGQENFDGAVSLPIDDRDTDPVTGFNAGTAGGFEGRYGLLNVDTAHAINYIHFRDPMEGLPTVGVRPVYLEIHYKNNTPFQFLIEGTNASGTEKEVIPIYEFNRSANWNKVYINLTPFLGTTRYPKYHLQFRAVLERDLQTGKFVQDSGTILLDNIRVVYF